MKKFIWTSLVILVISCFAGVEANAFSLTRYAQIKGAGSYLKLSNNGNLLAIQRNYSTGSVAEVWQVKPAKRISFVRLGESGSVLDFTKDGKKLLIGRGDNYIYLEMRDASNGKLIRSFGETKNAYSGAISPNGSLVALESDRKASLREVGSGKVIRTWNTGDEHPFIVGFSPDGKSIIEGGGNIQDWGVGRAVDVATGREKWKHPGAYSRIAWSAGGRLVTTPLGMIRNINTGKLSPYMTNSSIYGYNVAGNYVGYLAAVNRGDYMKANEADMTGEILLWDIRNGQIYRRIHWKGGSFGGISFSWDGKTFAASQLNTVVIYKVRQ